ncbi:unnamed protein product [Durusdinium trenchii]|uniref:Uncharacterized protein n=1 Tax=Durusdinium trenchii TaxID=1381693 RepID=A0ABP0QZD9_9DINO
MLQWRFRLNQQALAKTMGLGYDPSVQDNLGRAAANLFDQFVDAARARGGVPGLCSNSLRHLT